MTNNEVYFEAIKNKAENIIKEANEKLTAPDYSKMSDTERKDALKKEVEMVRNNLAKLSEEINTFLKSISGDISKEAKEISEKAKNIKSLINEVNELLKNDSITKLFGNEQNIDTEKTSKETDAQNADIQKDTASEPTEKEIEAEAKEIKDEIKNEDKK